METTQEGNQRGKIEVQEIQLDNIHKYDRRWFPHFYRTYEHEIANESKKEQQARLDRNTLSWSTIEMMRNIHFDNLAALLESIGKEEQQRLIEPAHQIMNDLMPMWNYTYRIQTINILRSIPNENLQEFTNIVVSLFPPKTISSRPHDRLWIAKLLKDFLAENNNNMEFLDAFTSQIQLLFTADKELNSLERAYIVSKCSKMSSEELDELVESFLKIRKDRIQAKEFIHKLVPQIVDSYLGSNKKVVIGKSPAEEKSSIAPKVSPLVAIPKVSPLVAMHRLAQKPTAPQEDSYTLEKTSSAIINQFN